MDRGRYLVRSRVEAPGFKKDFESIHICETQSHAAKAAARKIRKTGELPNGAYHITSTVFNLWLY